MLACRVKHPTVSYVRRPHGLCLVGAEKGRSRGVGGAAVGRGAITPQSGAGAEGRVAIGLVVLSGVTVATLTTLLVVPGTYGLIARFTGSPGARLRELDSQLGDDASDSVREVVQQATDQMREWGLRDASFAKMLELSPFSQETLS